MGDDQVVLALQGGQAPVERGELVGRLAPRRSELEIDDVEECKADIIVRRQHRLVLQGQLVAGGPQGLGGYLPRHPGHGKAVEVRRAEGVPVERCHNPMRVLRCARDPTRTGTVPLTSPVRPPRSKVSSPRRPVTRMSQSRGSVSKAAKGASTGCARPASGRECAEARARERDLQCGLDYGGRKDVDVPARVVRRKRISLENDRRGSALARNLHRERRGQPEVGEPPALIGAAGGSPAACNSPIGTRTWPAPGTEDLHAFRQRADAAAKSAPRDP